MNPMVRLFKKIINVIVNPHDFYFHRINPYLRHRKYHECHPTAVVNHPIKFNPKNIYLGEKVYIFKNARIGCVFEYAGEKFSPELVIGANTTIQQNIHITCAGKISIGNWCAITHNVTITDIDHTFAYPPTRTTPPFLIP